jgi:hypothetical protein
MSRIPTASRLHVSERPCVRKSRIGPMDASFLGDLSCTRCLCASGTCTGALPASKGGSKYGQIRVQRVKYGWNRRGWERGKRDHYEGAWVIIWQRAVRAEGNYGNVVEERRELGRVPHRVLHLCHTFRRGPSSCVSLVSHFQAGSLTMYYICVTLSGGVTWKDGRQ